MFYELDLNKLGIESACKVKYMHIEVPDITSCAEEMIESISDTSWLDKLGIIEKTSFEARAKRTIDKLVREILNKVDDTVTGHVPL